MAGPAATLGSSAAESAAGSGMPDAAGQVLSGDAADKSRLRTLMSAVTPNGVAVTVACALLAVIALLLADGFAGIDSQFDRIDARFANMDTRFANIDAKIDTQVGMLRADMNRGFAQVDARFAEVNAVLLDHGERLARIETGHGERLARIEADHGERLARIEADHGERLARIEAGHGERLARIEAHLAADGG
ncbi:MAG: hypothetical protein OXI97_05315 [Acidimicrobiaceae bacterium]|nr:hypothetical protein [Acidimicrobiaceae bacterium]